MFFVLDFVYAIRIVCQTASRFAFSLKTSEVQIGQIVKFIGRYYIPFAYITKHSKCCPFLPKKKHTPSVRTCHLAFIEVRFSNPKFKSKMAKQILLFLFVLVVEFSLAKSYADESPHPGSTRPPPFNLTKLPGVKSIYPEFTGLPPFSRGLPGSRNFSSNRIGGRKSDVYPNWTPLICDGSDKGESGRLKSPAARDINGPVVMLIHNGLFLFKIGSLKMTTKLIQHLLSRQNTFIFTTSNLSLA